MIIDQVPHAAGALKGRVAVVTGAGRGIGREAARVLARLGAATVVAELHETGQETADLIRAEGGEALFVQTDVADEASVARLHAWVVEAYGQADILVNNATVFTVGPLWQQSLAEWDRVMSVNLRGAFLCIRAFLPGMLARKSGVLLTMESSEGMPYIAPYLASKVGLRSLAMSLAQEVGEQSGVSVYCFGPGMVETPGLMESLERLPAYYGMTLDEFIRQSGVFMLSAEVCAAGLAGTILHAREFHGQQAGYASGLARLGLNVAGEPVTDTAEEPVTVTAAAAQPVTDPAASPWRDALALNLKLEEMLRANIREYDELTLFQRPLVRRMFQNGAGLKVEEWLALAQAMTRQLERLSAPGAAPDWQEPRPQAYMANLQRLAQFIRKQETDARGFFRNADALNRALQALQERHDLVTALTRALEAGCDVDR